MDTHKKNKTYTVTESEIQFLSDMKQHSSTKKKSKKSFNTTLQKVQTKEFKSKSTNRKKTRKENERDCEYCAKHACRCHTGKRASFCSRSERPRHLPGIELLLRSVRSN